MLTARAYSLRQKTRLAISLSWIAGYTNVVTLIVTGMMVSHVTGNLTHVGQLLSEWDLAAGLKMLAVPVCFVAGSILSGVSVTIATRLRRRSIYIVPMLLQAMLLTAVSIMITLGERDDSERQLALAWPMVLVTSAAMGLQNATITSISGAVVRTTHLTGVLTDIGLDLVNFCFWLRDKTRRRGIVRWKRVLRGIARQPDAQRIALLASIAGSFLFGVVAGTLIHDHARWLALMPPVAFLLFILVIDWREPIADLKEVDHVADPELKQHGIDPAMLPHELGIYRLAPPMSGLKHHTPDFVAWVEDLPPHVRVCVLSLASGLRLDSDAALSLQAATSKLRNTRRRLILAGVCESDFELFDRHGIIGTVDPNDLCPDLEFAIARALGYVENHTTLTAAASSSSPLSSPRSLNPS